MKLSFILGIFFHRHCRAALLGGGRWSVTDILSGQLVLCGGVTRYPLNVTGSGLTAVSTVNSSDVDEIFYFNNLKKTLQDCYNAAGCFCSVVIV